MTTDADIFVRRVPSALTTLLPYQDPSSSVENRPAMSAASAAPGGTAISPVRNRWPSFFFSKARGRRPLHSSCLTTFITRLGYRASIMAANSILAVEARPGTAISDIHQRRRSVPSGSAGSFSPERSPPAAFHVLCAPFRSASPVAISFLFLSKTLHPRKCLGMSSASTPKPTRAAQRYQWTICFRRIVAGAAGNTRAGARSNSLCGRRATLKYAIRDVRQYRAGFHRH